MQQFTEDDLQVKLTDSSGWITDMIVNNCKKLSILEVDKLSGWHVPMEKQLGKILGSDDDI